MFETKFVIALLDNLANWQKLNVTAFLSTGVAAAQPEIIGEIYCDAEGNSYNPMSIQPIIVLSADGQTLSKMHQRLLGRDIPASLFIEDMFKTGHDSANRAVFAKYSPENANVVGLAFRADKKIADKITKGARMHS